MSEEAGDFVDFFLGFFAEKKKNLTYTPEEIAALRNNNNNGEVGEVLALLNIEQPPLQLNNAQITGSDGSEDDNSGSDSESDYEIGNVDRENEDDENDQEDEELVTNKNPLDLLESLECCANMCLRKLQDKPSTRKSFEARKESITKIMSLKGYSRHVALLAYRGGIVCATCRWPENESQHLLPRGLNYVFDKQTLICKSAYASYGIAKMLENK
jgi:hypothetical protein